MIREVEKWRWMVEGRFSGIISENRSYRSLIDRFKKTFNEWVDIILAIIQKESGGNDKTTGDNGNSIGLMQLNYGAGTPQFLGFTGEKDDLFDPLINIDLGIKYFLYQLNRYQDIEKAILAYNAGSVKYNQAGDVINPSYLADILSYLSEKKTSSLPERSSLSESISSTKDSNEDKVVNPTTEIEDDRRPNKTKLEKYSVPAILGAGVLIAISKLVCQ